MNPDTDFLRSIYIFQDLTDDELDSIAKIIKSHSCKAGDSIMKEGEEGKTMYMIASGEVTVSKALTMRFGENDFRETEKAMTRFQATDNVVFGEMALITEEKRSATITAVTDCMLYEITREDFLYQAGSQSELGFKVMYRLSELLSRRLKETGQDVVRLTTALSIALSQ